jgi:DNA-binding NarL/FixJ family response regulator
VRVALLNDFDLIVTGLTKMLEPFGQIQIVDDAVGRATSDGTAVDVVLYDTYGRRGMPWPEVQALVDEPAVRHVAVFTFAFVGDVIDEAVRRGVDGYLWKGLAPSTLVDQLVRIAGGERVVSQLYGYSRSAGAGYRWPFDDVGLTARESEVLALVSEGLPNRDIAEALFVAPETVKTHVRSIFRKLDVRTRAQATARALRDTAFSRGTYPIQHLGRA